MLLVTSDMVELEVSVRLQHKEGYFVSIYNSFNRFINKPFYALGDSTTYGAGEGGSDSTGGSISWADHLIKKILFSSYHKIAINSTLCMDDGIHPKLATQIAQVTDNSLVTVMIGTNDINCDMPLGDVDSVLAMSSESLNDTTNFAMAFRMNMETLIKQCPHSTILCMMPISPLGTSLNGTGYLEPNPTLRAKVETYADVERKICAYLSIPVIETMKECGITPYAQTRLLVTSNIASSSFMADNYHPNGAGNEKIADYMRSQIIRFCS